MEYLKVEIVTSDSTVPVYAGELLQFVAVNGSVVAMVLNKDTGKIKAEFPEYLRCVKRRSTNRLIS